MTEAVIASSGPKDLARLLKFALAGPLSVGAAEADMIVLQAGGGQRRRIARALVDLAVARGLLTGGQGAYQAAPEARAWLRRALADPEVEAFQEQHRDMVAASIPQGLGGASRTVRRNRAESPLGHLCLLKDRDGKLFFPEEAIAAGERLAADFHQAGLQPRITSSWEPRLASRQGGAATGAAEIGDIALSARTRLNAAIDAMGPELSGVALDVCGFMKGLEVIERERQWPARSAKLMLRTALQALARHYDPPRPQSRRRTRHWGDGDYRPGLG